MKAAFHEGYIVMGLTLLLVVMNRDEPGRRPYRSNRYAYAPQGIPLTVMSANGDVTHYHCPRR